MEAYGSFELAKKVEEVHQKMFEDAYSKLKAGENIESKKYLICPTCGYPATPAPPKNCPVCGTKGSKFIEYEFRNQI